MFSSSEIGAQMQLFAIGWLAVEVAAREGDPSRTALYLGVLGLARAIPGIALGVLGGVLADRFDRRMLILVGQLASAVSAAALAILAASGADISWVAAVVIVAATAYSMTLPAAFAAIPRVVGAEALMSGTGLVNASANIAMVAGPLIAGLLVLPVGVAGILGVQSVLHLLAVVFTVRVPRMPQHQATQTHPLRALRDGIVHTARDPLVGPLMVLAILVALFGRAVAYVMPAVTTEVLRVGAVELSWLLGARGIGTLAGSLAVASLDIVRRRATAAALCSLAFGIAAALFATQQALFGALIVAVALGLIQFLFSGFLNALLQTNTPDALRGRVLSLYYVTVTGVTPLGVMLLGSIGAAVGIGQAITMGAVVLVAGSLAVLLVPAAIRAELSSRNASRS
jgi:predicted MFS family arabinose efflux permease